MPFISPNLDAGDLDRRVTMFEPLYNEESDEIIDWRPVASVWASIQPTGGQERNEASRMVSTKTVTVAIRYPRSFKPDARWRIGDAEHMYEITTPLDIMRLRTQLRFECEEVL